MLVIIESKLGSKTISKNRLGTVYMLLAVLQVAVQLQMYHHGSPIL